MYEYVNTKAIDAVNEGKEVPKKIGDFKIKYVATDGWRGYYEASAPKSSGWLKIDGDWMTGNWDDAPDGHSSNDVESKLEALNARVRQRGGELQVIFLPSSNVFSTVYDVFVRGVNVEELKENHWDEMEKVFPNGFIK